MTGFLNMSHMSFFLFFFRACQWCMVDNKYLWSSYLKCTPIRKKMLNCSWGTWVALSDLLLISMSTLGYLSYLVSRNLVHRSLVTRLTLFFFLGFCNLTYNKLIGSQPFVIVTEWAKDRNSQRKNNSHCFGLVFFGHS